MYSHNGDSFCAIHSYTVIGCFFLWTWQLLALVGMSLSDNARFWQSTRLSAMLFLGVWQRLAPVVSFNKFCDTWLVQFTWPLIIGLFLLRHKLSARMRPLVAFWSIMALKGSALDWICRRDARLWLVVGVRTSTGIGYFGGSVLSDSTADPI